MYLARILGVTNTDHYTYFEKGHSIHATSNVPCKLDDNQKISIPLPSLILKSAKSPASIITNKGVYEKSPNYRKISSYELDSIKFDNTDMFSLDTQSHQYNYEKNFRYEYILHIYLKGYTVDPLLHKELKANCYSHVLANSSDEDLINEISKYRDLF
jgi:hypothetical protein